MNRRTANVKTREPVLNEQDHSPEQDRDFLLRLQAGDEGAWEQLVAEWSPRLYSYLSYNLRNSEETDDVLSETMLAVVQAIRTFDGKVTLATFIYSIAYRKVADHWRKLRVTQELDEWIAAPDAGYTNIEVYEALAELPEQSKQALLLRYYVGLSVSEIAEVLGRSYKATESLLSRVRRQFELAFLRSAEA
jgi:RNA polymerase sigma factor (sigma-70 family)